MIRNHRRYIGLASMVARLGGEPVPYAGPGFRVDQRSVLPGIELALVRNLAGAVPLFPRSGGRSLL
jgi:hypothetical protein